VGKTGPSRDLVLGAHVVPDLNVDHGRLVVFHKAGLETVGKGQRSDRRSREGNGFRFTANPREKEKSDREDDRARLGGLIEDSRQPAPNLKRPSVQSFDFIIEPHVKRMRNRGVASDSRESQPWARAADTGRMSIGFFSACDDRVYNRGCFVSELEKRLRNG
jgi:hypothetical protein